MRAEPKGITNQRAHHSARRTICNIHSLAFFLVPQLFKSMICSGTHRMFEGPARMLVLLFPIVLLVVIILPQTIRILREYERGVIFRLGKLLGVKGPGLIYLIPV